MKKPSTTAQGTSSKPTALETEGELTDAAMSSELCHGDLAQTLFSLKLEASKSELRGCFLAAKIFLEQFESEVLNGLSADTSLSDYDEITLNRQKRCEHALSEIDLRLCTMMIEARQSASLSESETEFSLDDEPMLDKPFETH